MTNQRLTVLAMLAMLGCAKHGPSAGERALLEDFRAVERACATQFATLKHEREVRLSADEISRRFETGVRTPWKAVRARIDAAPPLWDSDLDATLRRYVTEREAAWAEFAGGACCFNDEGKHFAAYREQDEVAEADAKHLAEILAPLELPALPPLPAEPPVVLQAPPPAPPGAAFIFVGRSVVRLDDTGFRVIASGVSTMDVLPDGTMWACTDDKVVHWDGTRAVEYKPKVSLGACAAGPDGKLWATHRDEGREHDKTTLLSFDRTTWSTIATTDMPDLDRAQLLVDRDNHVFVRGSIGSSGPRGPRALVGRTWKSVGLVDSVGSNYTEHMFRGGDGRMWVLYQVTHGKDSPLALAQLAPTGGAPPVFIDDYFQTSFLYGHVDAAGVATILDLRRDVIAQGPKTLRLPVPIVNDRHEQDGAGPFALDASGRIWIDLVDGLNVIDPAGKRTVFPRGSVETIHEPIAQIAVIGAGPKLPAPGPVATRTVTGTVVNGSHGIPRLSLMMCGETSSEPPCAEALPFWTATTDENGRFTFTGVPRWKNEIRALVGTRGHQMWRDVEIECCNGDATELQPGPVARPLQY